MSPYIASRNLKRMESVGKKFEKSEFAIKNKLYTYVEESRISESVYLEIRNMEDDYPYNVNTLLEVRLSSHQNKSNHEYLELDSKLTIKEIYEEIQIELGLIERKPKVVPTYVKKEVELSEFDIKVKEEIEKIPLDIHGSARQGRIDRIKKRIRKQIAM